MAQFYTLEEAAKVLGMSAEELKAKAQSREVRAFLDGGSWRFRVVDVDELARRRGLGSDAELRLSDLDLPAGKSSGELEELDLSEFHMGVSKSDLGSESAHISKTDKGGRKKSADTGSDHDMLLDDLTVPPNPVTGSSSVIIGAPTSHGRPSDSDVRLVPDNMMRGASDSDVQLASPGLKPSDSDVTLIKEDTADHGIISGSGSSSETSVRVSPLLGSSAEVPAAGADSDFELNPSSELIDALQPDSGSDFELSALDASDEFEATPMSKPSDSDVTASDPKMAGINLSRRAIRESIFKRGPDWASARLIRSSWPRSPTKHSKQPSEPRAPPSRPRPSRRSPRPRPLRSRRVKRISSTTRTSRSMSTSLTPTPTTRPCSSKPPATSTWKTATPARRYSRSTKRPSTRMHPRPWPRRRLQKTKRTKRTTASIPRSRARWGRGRRRKARLARNVPRPRW